ncbi:MAG: methyltransferase domain-containing protein [Bacteroidales bacterium]|nr:methyltransferase domain-containing protein [Bacteroidales bacterium]
MNVDQFIDLFEEEVKNTDKLRYYYRFLSNKTLYLFRKVYFQQRLEFIARTINDKDAVIWDCGCGYGTTGFFLALNGFKVYGTTIEYYIDLIGKRQEFWEKHGDISRFVIEYKNIFKEPPLPGSYDYIILQDVLHHLEPIDEALTILHNALKPGGQLVCIEENGNNIFQYVKLFIKRGNRRIVTIRDHQTGENILMGNENIRSLAGWDRLFKKHNLVIDKKSQEYIRLLPPFFFNNSNYEKMIRFEQKTWGKTSFLREYFYSGINFTAHRED